VYPPEYNSPIVNECPDGSIIQEEKERLEKWGNCWSRYYELNVDYFMSHSARNVMDILTKVSCIYSLIMQIINGNIS
jgi:COP9 signalosome complex subunit 5